MRMLRILVTAAAVCALLTGFSGAVAAAGPGYTVVMTGLDNPRGLTFATVVAGGPTGAAMALPTVILSASGLPVLSTGALAVGGTE